MSSHGHVGFSLNAARERFDLGKQYRAIGIGAVAAALTFSGDRKNDASTPAVPKAIRFRDIDDSAA
jgi:hypothetical protein